MCGQCFLTCCRKVGFMLKKGLVAVVGVLVLGTFLSGCVCGSGNSSDVKYPCLSAFEHEMQKGKHLKVAYLGGSITWGACASDQGKTSYRALVSEFLEKAYPEAHLKFIDAAIGGTPSKLGVFRMDRDVLPYKPDLTFIEFAVNDGGRTTDSVETMEGIIRKLKKSNPDMAIFIIVLGAGRGNKYGTPRYQEHIKLAEYYGLPFADVCGPVKKKIKAGKLDTDKILADGCHPCDAGYRIYADIIIDTLKKDFNAKGKAVPYPKPLTANRYESAQMLELSKLKNLGEWQKGKVATLGTWFDHQPSRWISSVIVPKKDGAKISFDLNCSGVGLYYEIMQQGGRILVEADGKDVLNISTNMKQHYNRVAWRFKLLQNSKPRKITLVAPKKKNVKAAYLLYTR